MIGKDERAIQILIDSLLPELQEYVFEDDGKYCISGPLLIKTDLQNYDPVELNTEFTKKCASEKEYRANVRFAPLSYLWLIEKPYRMDALIDIQDEISDAQYWHCLEHVWTLTEFVHENIEEWFELFSSKRRYRALLMSRVDRKYFQTLPNILTVYRGYQEGLDDNMMGLAWTLSLEKADYFAHRFEEIGEPKVVSGVCNKSDVICYTNGREEQEIIIDPLKISGIKPVKSVTQQGERKKTK